MRILIVCLGNICRSPLGEGILQQKAREAGLDWIVESAGTNSYHIGQPPHTLSQKVASKNGIDISCQRARLFVKEDFDRYDKIYAMANDVMEDIKRIGGEGCDMRRAKLFLEALFPGENMDVPDPWYGPEPGYHEVYALIEKACDAIIEKYKVNQKLTAKQNV
jgi:protein-tyrosine phosphatase